MLPTRFYMLVHVNGDLHVLEVSDDQLGSITWKIFDDECPPRWRALRDEIKAEGYNPDFFSLKRVYWQPAPLILRAGAG